MKKGSAKKSTGLTYRKSSLAVIAFWQFMTFLMLLLLVWVNEVFDLPALLFAAHISNVNVFSGCILSAFVIVVGILSVSYTYLQHRRLLSKMITVCARCGKVKIDSQLWEEIESYLAQQSGSALSHGLCPECYDLEMKKMERYLRDTPPEINPARPLPPRQGWADDKGN